MSREHPCLYLVTQWHPFLRWCLSYMQAGDKVKSLTYLELATRRGETAAAHMRDVILESLSAANTQLALSDADKWKPRALHPRRWGDGPHQNINNYIIQMAIAYVIRNQNWSMARMGGANMYAFAASWGVLPCCSHTFSICTKPSITDNNGRSCKEFPWQ